MEIELFSEFQDISLMKDAQLPLPEKNARVLLNTVIYSTMTMIGNLPIYKVKHYRRDAVEDKGTSDGTQSQHQFLAAMRCGGGVFVSNH